MSKQKDEIDSLINISDEPFVISDDVDFDGPGEIMTMEEYYRRTGRRVITRKTVPAADGNK